MAEEALRLARQEEKERAVAAKEAARAAKEAAKEAARAAREKKPEAPASVPTIVTAPGAPPVASARPAPGADPVWTSFLSPSPAANAVAEPPAAPTADAPKGKRGKAPNIVAGPALGADPFSESPETESAAAQPAPVASAPSALVPAPPSALATRAAPLIVEPKAPPKPTSVPKKKDRSFSSRGDHELHAAAAGRARRCDRAEKPRWTRTPSSPRRRSCARSSRTSASWARWWRSARAPSSPCTSSCRARASRSARSPRSPTTSPWRWRPCACASSRPSRARAWSASRCPNKDRETVFLKEIVEQDVFQKAAVQAHHVPRQGHRGHAVRARPGQGAAPAHRRHHRLRQIGGGQLDDHEHPAQVHAGGSPLHHGGPEDARALGLRGHPASAACRSSPIRRRPRSRCAGRWRRWSGATSCSSEAGVRNIAGYNKLVEAAPEETKAALAPRRRRRRRTRRQVDAHRGCRGGRERGRRARAGQGRSKLRRGRAQTRTTIREQMDTRASRSRGRRRGARGELHAESRCARGSADPSRRRRSPRSCRTSWSSSTSSRT